MSACFVMTYYPIHCPIYRLSSCQNSQTGTVGANAFQILEPP
uniref:Uncharacterized protein n=1 Tax=Vitis vinifera TaxID=29760 RepID=F6HGT4_VITVI